MRIAAFLLLLLASPLCAQATFSVWSYQLDAGPVHAHSWATFAKGKEAVCISWMTSHEVVRFVKLRAEEGANWNHTNTLAYAKSIGAKVQQFGPYDCSDHLFERAKVHAAKLESGEVKYKAVTIIHPKQRANCVHAILGVTNDPLFCRFAYGARASALLAWHLRGRP